MSAPPRSQTLVLVLVLVSSVSRLPAGDVVANSLAQLVQIHVQHHKRYIVTHCSGDNQAAAPIS
eukprot:scaffold19948_cov16-Prasinocladus_malaysianus.AAC.2